MHQLVVDAPGHPGQVEPVLLTGQPGVEDDLEEQVAQLLFEVGVGRRRATAVIERGQGVEDLVGLLDQVGHERRVGLGLVPRAVLAQRVHERLEPCHLDRR